MIKTAISLLMSFIMLIFNTIGAALPGFVPKAKPENDLTGLTDIFDVHPLAREIAVVQSSKTSDEELAAIICLQGLVNRDEASIFINYGYDSITELSDLESAGCKLLYADSNGNAWRLESLIRRYSSHINNNGYVLFTSKKDCNQINMAFNFASVYGWLAIPQSMEQAAKTSGLEKLEDLTGRNIDIAYQRNFYNKNKKTFKKNLLVHLDSCAQGLRDLAVAQKIFIMFVREDDRNGRAFRDEIFGKLDAPAAILGWGNYEEAYTESVSSFGHYVIPSDNSYNTSILTCNRLTVDKLGRQSDGVKLDPTKHYVSIVYSDGDNAQWISNGYNEFYAWQSYDIDIPITWTFAPLMKNFSSTAVKKAISNVGNDSFITGPSGAGYARISQMSGRELRAYSDLTAAAMLETGLTTMTLLDYVPNSYSNLTFANKLKYFARYENIHGGILQMDPGRYASGEGRVYFVNDKPFISVRLSLWHPSGNPDEVTHEWLSEQANIVNASPADISSINGYTVINVHPWTVNADDLAYFVSCLGDNIEVISADDMITALTENIPHEYAEPQKS